MNTSRSTAYIVGIIIIIVIAIGVYASTRGSHSDVTQTASTTPETTQQDTSNRTLTTALTYSCDKGKTVSVAYYEGPEAPQPAPGEMPTPTGTADVSLDGGATTTLNQTISADGVRYATADDSFVVWNKGKNVLVMRNNSMDLDYTNCTQQ
jgi:membrane-bound inhibitor of C-type lysozyme